jgi:hypothetical protein
MTIETPVGIDIPIQNLQNRFTEKLFPGKKYTSYGRAFIMDQTPMVYSGANEYQEVLLDDSQATSFFTVEPEIEIKNNEATARVDIHFFVNLATLFEFSHRAVEEAHVMVNEVLNINTFGFRVFRMIQGIESIKDFKIRKPELMDMQPYYCFKFECSLIYKLC